MAGPPDRLPDVDLTHLRTFCQVARSLSFSRAAEALHLSQPAVSRQVQALERTLGLRLFAERGRRVVLSDAGRALYDYAERILRLCGEAAQAMEALRSLERGRVRLAASTTPAGYVLPPLLAAFRRRHPGVDLELLVAHSTSAARRVAEGEADLGVVGAPPPCGGLVPYPYLEDELVLVCPPGHPLAGKASDPPDLAGETLLLREEGSGTRAAVEEYLHATGLRFGARLVLGCSEAVKRAVAAGAGVAFLSRFAVAGERARGELAVVPGPRIRRAFHLVLPKEARLLPAALALRAFLEKAAPTIHDVHA